MFSFPAWPRFPFVSLPTAIQSRFLSFLLKRSLGHLVKPGQLDPAQIDAQIGNGFVQVNNVELDHDAMNEHLNSLYLPFILEAGSIGKVSARIPLANLLTTSVALSLSDLSLTFIHSPRLSPAAQPSQATGDLTESVVTIAETFVHDELSPQENEALRESLDVMSPTLQHPPGYIDPFLSTEDLDSARQPDEHDESGIPRDDADLSNQGVSLIATLIERLLSRFECEMSGITIRLVLPGKTEFTFRFRRIAYSTEDVSEASVPLYERRIDDGEVRVLKATGVSISTRDLTPRHVARAASPLSSSASSEDDEDVTTMSQSLASLPPPPSIHSTSPESSMYHSATSSIRGTSPEPVFVPEEKEAPEEMILSLGHESDPVVFQLVTPRLGPSQTDCPDTHDNPAGSPLPGPTANIRLVISLGSIAVALDPIQVRSVVILSDALSRPTKTKTKTERARDSLGNGLEVGLYVKSLTALLLRSTSPLLPSRSVTDHLHEFFVGRTSTSPHLPHLRIRLDALEVSFKPLSVLRTHDSHRAPKDILKASLGDVSVFAFSFNLAGGRIVSPVLISDPNLGVQYERETKSPFFDVTDWTKASDSSHLGKPSHWRIRPLQFKRKPGDVFHLSEATSNSQLPVMQARIEKGSINGIICRVDVLPLHLFIDVRLLDGAVGFVNTATTVNTLPGQDEVMVSSNVDPDETPPATPRATEYAKWPGNSDEEERKRLEDLVINDFSINEDNRTSTSTSTDDDTNYTARLALLRVEIRVPPPHSSTTPRSGAVILDVHGIQIDKTSAKSLEGRNTPRNDKGRKVGPAVIGKLELRRLLVAATLPGATKASTFISIDAQVTSSKYFGVDTSPSQHTLPKAPAPLPSIYLRASPVLPRHLPVTSPPGAASSFSLDINLLAVDASISKPVLNALTFWADDITQCLYNDVEQAASASDTSGKSKDPSIIGSRFFAKRTASSRSSDSGRDSRKSEFVVKVAMAEAQIELLVPRKNEGGQTRSLRIRALDVDFLAEIKPEGKDETVVTMGVTDLTMNDTSATGNNVKILALTTPSESIPPSKSIIKLRYNSIVDNETAAKESRLRLTISGFTHFLTPDITWIADTGSFMKTPEGAFESVIPSERTKVYVKIIDGSFHITANNDPGALVVYLGELEFSTDLIGESLEMDVSTAIRGSCIFFIDDVGASSSLAENHGNIQSNTDHWNQSGYALLAELANVGIRFHQLGIKPSNTQVYVDSFKLKLHACADTLPAIGVFANNLSSSFLSPTTPKKPTAMPVNQRTPQKRDIFDTVDENAFRQMPDLGPAPDMIYDDLPNNMDYLDASFGAAAGLRELHDDDLFDFEPNEPEIESNRSTNNLTIEGLVSNLGGETIRMLDPNGIRVVEGHFENTPLETANPSGIGDAKVSIRVQDCDVTVSLYDGFDWVRTRETIEREVKAIKRRLVKIRQLLASGQTPDDSIEETSAILFNSVSIGLSHDTEELERGALIAAIDEELNEDGGSETASQSSWQSFKPRPHQETPKFRRLRGKKLVRSKASQIDFCLSGLQAEVDQYCSDNPLVSRALVTVENVEILDNIKTSTWKKFLTELRTDFRGNVRETASDMIRAELRIVRPDMDLPTEEGRFRAKILPLKLHVDQDALDFLKKFFSFQDPRPTAVPDSEKIELYFQHVEVFPVDLKLDYKPKRVDYKALREGKTIELMNFFHFDGAEITLRHITLSGVTGWSRLFDTLNDLWTPDVKANQLADIISGVSPIRSLVNVGSGVADLVLLPIAQYRKDKRVVRGVQKGTSSFVRSTAMEAIKLGARLATGTQVILEQAETVLGGQGQFRDTVTAEALQSPRLGDSDEESEVADLISKYAEQPQDVREGMQSAYRSLSKNLNSAAQTILAVPMEVYERSGDEGPIRAVVRAVPIAVLKPMIGASEAVSKTLFGLRNTMDPEVKHDNQAKYKQR